MPQFSSVAQSCLTLWPHGLHHARLPCPSPTPRSCSNSCPSRRWCHPTISSSVVPFSTCPWGLSWVSSFQFSSIQSLCWLFATPWTAVCQASLSITNSQSLLKLMSTELVMPSNHLIPLSSPSPPAFNLSEHQGLFQQVSSSHQVALKFQHQSFQWIFRTDFL